ncbi:MAG TPA: alcohol dehydrogenase catalytic domain-containing protein [Trebonia sp.]|jgi:alcohol dehydrogenase|nr:alcohol dehydrogenase catalytic domain-containing protein [Trebonia sp.]
MRVTSAVLDAVADSRPYSDSRPLRLTELELGAPGPRELLVRITAAGLCHSDLSVINGDRIRPLPMALGHEAAGEVVRVGASVRDVRPGDQVTLVYVPSCAECAYCRVGEPAMCERGAAANGAGELLSGGRRLRFPGGGTVHHHLGVSAFADHAVVDRSSAVVVDEAVPSAVAALLGCAMSTGYGAVARTAGVGAGESVGVFGLGGVGLSSVMAARALGADPIIAVDPVPAKRALALQLGATIAVPPEQADGMFARLPGGGARWTFEAVGSAAVLAAAFAATGRGGTTVSAGLPHPSARLDIPALTVVAEARTLKGSYMGSTRPQEDIPAMARLWLEGRLPIERLISAELRLEDVNLGMERLADGSAIRQILRPGRETAP